MCKYCEGQIDDRAYLVGEIIYISEDCLIAVDELELEETKINYCPMCGKKLGVD